MPQATDESPNTLEPSTPSESAGSATVKRAPKTHTTTNEHRSALERVGTASVYLAIAIFLLNMVGAWYMVARSGGVVGRALIDPRQPTAASLALEKMSSADGNGHVFINHLVTAELQLLTVQNQHTISVVAMSAAFALLAIGFALFVMGAEGAFKIAGKLSDGQNLVLKSTAPGLLCFFLSALLIYATLTHGHIQIVDAARDVLAQGPAHSVAKPSEPTSGSVKPVRSDIGPAGPPRPPAKPVCAGSVSDTPDGGSKP